MSAAVDPPRTLVVASGVWLLAALLLSLGVRLPESLTLGSLFPAIRMCLIACFAGLLVGWPLLRLSVAAPARPVAVTLLDLATLVVLLQAVLWPLRLATAWPLERTLLIDALVVAQLAGTAGVVVVGCATNSSLARAVAMVAVLGLSAGIGSSLGLPEGLPGIVATMDSTTSLPTAWEWSRVEASALWFLPTLLVGASGAVLLSAAAGSARTVAHGRAGR